MPLRVVRIPTRPIAGAEILLVGAVLAGCGSYDGGDLGGGRDPAARSAARAQPSGDGIDESFTAQMIVSDTEFAPKIPGTQTLWVQGVAYGHFNRS